MLCFQKNISIYDCFIVVFRFLTRYLLNLFYGKKIHNMCICILCRSSMIKLRRWLKSIVMEINSLRLSDAYRRQETNHYWFRQWLIAWSVPSHYLNQCWNIVNWTLRNKPQWNLNKNSYIFIQDIAFENVVWKIAAILLLPQCVKDLCISHSQYHCCWWPGIARSLGISCCDIDLVCIFFFLNTIQHIEG